MKTNKLMMLALGALLAVSTATYAQDEKKPEGKPPGNHQGGPGGPGGRQRMSPDEQLKHLSEALSLTEDQKPKVKAILEDGAKQRAALKDLSQDERRAKGKELMEAQKAKMKEVLTADQFAKYDKMGQHRGPGGPGGEGKPKGEKPEDKKE